MLATDLIKAVPAEHKKFLADLVWVHEEVRFMLLQFVAIVSYKRLIHGILIKLNYGNTLCFGLDGA